ncbi:hypothetical protein HUG10_07525 [Halorarum halophilum]|uniref:Uncharacterized protein n=1 Tax=Halorarum halophilum TaxID=2743090 RepID=A0A7D5GBC7_9EURY|nr:hypothetical protein [Halobaculum halophilum]QLG27406.1 hypothetical protein HUG10_07525 [Halobaculum halophilum]
MLLDTGSIMLLLFGTLSVLLLGVLGVGMVFQFTSNLVLGALALSVLLAVDGLVLILLSTNA